MHKIEAVVFDFDGTLVESNQIKRQAFFEVVDTLGGDLEVFKAVYDEFGHLTRYEIFASFIAKQANPALSSEVLLRAYSQLTYERIVRCPEIHGATEVLAALSAKGIKCFIDSATPETELRPIVQARGFTRFLTGVYGTPISKTQNLENILKTGGFTASAVAFVGDGIPDYQAARALGCQFIGINYQAPDENALALQGSLLPLLQLLT